MLITLRLQVRAVWNSLEQMSTYLDLLEMSTEDLLLCDESSPKITLVTDYINLRQNDENEYHWFKCVSFFGYGYSRTLKLQAARKFDSLLKGEAITPFSELELKALHQKRLGEKVKTWERANKRTLENMNEVIRIFNSDGWQSTMNISAQLDNERFNQELNPALDHSSQFILKLLEQSFQAVSKQLSCFVGEQRILRKLGHAFMKDYDDLQNKIKPARDIFGFDHQCV